jgi:hypothetical protein
MCSVQFTGTCFGGHPSGGQFYRCFDLRGLPVRDATDMKVGVAVTVVVQTFSLLHAG